MQVLGRSPISEPHSKGHRLSNRTTSTQTPSHTGSTGTPSTPKSTNNTSACQYSRRIRLGTMSSTARPHSTKEGTLASSFSHLLAHPSVCTWTPHGHHPQGDGRHHTSVGPTRHGIRSLRYHYFRFRLFVCFCLFVCVPFRLLAFDAGAMSHQHIEPKRRGSALAAIRGTNVCIRAYTD